MVPKRQLHITFISKALWRIFLSWLHFSLFRIHWLLLFFLVKPIQNNYFVKIVEAQPQQQANITRSITTLSEARYLLAATSSGELVFFGGGYNATGPSDRVDICNVTSGSWTTATLSVPCSRLAATSSGNLVFFAGGWDGNSTFYNQVDIYNVSSGNWSTATLSQARCCLAATSVGNFVLFAGGYNYYNSNLVVIYDVVDIYIVASNTWAVNLLSQSRYDIAATSVANRYAFFAGGWNIHSVSNIVDIYDSALETFSAATLSQARTLLAATSLGNLAFFGGGFSSQASNVVDIFNSTSQTWSTATLSQARYFLAAASIGDIVAFGGGSPDGFTGSAIVDMYNETSNIWATLSLLEPRYLLAAPSSSNQIFFGGGIAYNGPSNLVEIFIVPAVTSSVPAFVAPSAPTSTQSSLSAGAAVGISLGVLLPLIGASVLLLFYIYRRKYRSVSLRNTTTTAERTSNVEQLLETQLHEKSIKFSQIPFNEIVLEKEIGEGSYGMVYVGRWKHSPVALKFCQKSDVIDEFIREVKIMIQLPPHPNVVQMFGISFNKSQAILIMEYCEGGSLDRFLFQGHPQLTEQQMIAWVKGIASGMYHLHKHNIVHRDLAARNILLSQATPNAQPKISDFGMSRIIISKNTGKTKSNIGPVRWMAPESIATRIYSEKSDVWSFGIVVYEIVAQTEPHKNMDDLQAAIAIRDEGLTPKIPSHCPQFLRELMMKCWNRNPEQRPTFEQVCNMFQQVPGITSSVV